MRGYFDNDEPEGEEPEEPEERGHDTELTLSTGAQLGIVFGLLFLCGLCFGLGYWVGHKPSPAAPATAATQPAAPDQEPLQGNDTIPKPSADAQVPPAQPPESDSTNPTPTQPAPATAGQPKEAASSPPSAPAAPAPAQPATPGQPAFSPATNQPQGAQAASPVRPAFPGAAGEYMVQVAAVSHAEDAYVLVNALRNRGFPATAQRVPSDGLIHVRIGPFATHEQANRMCTRLLDDGYNALVQP